MPTQDPHAADRWFHALAPQDQLFADRYADLLQQAATYLYAPDAIYEPLEGVRDVVVSDDDVRERIRRIDGGENTREAVRYRGSDEARYPFGDLPFDQQRALVERIDELGTDADALLISDYLKGVVSRGVAAAAAAVAARRGVPLLVDPKVPHVDYYAGARVVTPNHHEAEAVTHMRIRSSDDARQAARKFRDRVRCESVLITRGEHGMWLLTPAGEVDLPAEAREVADVTGAGDTVIGALALGLAAGASLADAARLANCAAGIVVGKFGPATVSAEELRTRG